MVRLVDKLNTPRAVAIVLVLFLVVDGLLYYRYQLAESTAAATPSLDASLSVNREVGGPSIQQVAGAEETYNNEGEQPESEEKGVLGAQEIEPEPAPPAPVLSRYPPASAPLMDNLTPVTGGEKPAVLPALEPAYPEPVYEQEGDYQYAYE
jgi:hypothetical protein